MDGEATVRIEISDDLGPGAGRAEAALRGRARNAGDGAAYSDSPDRETRGLGEPRRVTFAEADAIADTVCAGLLDAGLRDGDVVALQLPNTVEAPLLILGAWRAGLIPCLLPLMWRQAEVHQAFSQAEPKAVIGVGRFADERPAATLGEAAAGHKNVRFVFAFGEDVPDGVMPVDAWLAAPGTPEPQEELPSTASEDISGRTALMTWSVSRHGSCPVPRTHGELMTLARLFMNRLRLNDGDVVLNPYPHTGIAALAGQLVAPLLAGAQVALHLPFDFDVFATQLRRENVTYTAVPPPVIAALEERHNLRSGALALNRLGCVWPSPHGVKSGPGLFETPVPIFDIHNFGELAVMVRERGSGADPSLLPLGKIYAGDDEDDDPVLETKVRGSVTGENSRQILKGTLLVRGLTVPSGPFAHAAAPDEPVLRPDAQGFLDTGIGCIVSETPTGHFRCQKSEDVIYHGGAVIAAGELDRLYGEFSEFLDAAVFVLDDAVVGERIFAAVVPRPELSPSLARLKDFLAEKCVAAYKTPDQLVIVKAIPRGQDGAVLRDQILRQI